MNRRTILIGTCVMGSLVGLGFLANYVYGDKPDESRQDNPVKEPQKEGHNGYNRVENRPAPHSQNLRQNKSGRTKKRPVEKQEVKPEPKATMVEIQEKEPPIADEFPLRLGSKGERVERLQVWLMRNYGWTGNKVTGEFDEKTEALLKKFLKKTELDEATYYKMKMGKPVYEQIIMR